jgi:hypothetical protein
MRRRARARLLRTLAACDGDPADLLELYYWSKEPGFTQLIRAIATMPEHTRAALETFIPLARDSRSVSAALDSRACSLFVPPKPPECRDRHARERGRRQAASPQLT